jgi:hypothetical protein
MLSYTSRASISAVIVPYWRQYALLCARVRLKNGTKFKCKGRAFGEGWGRPAMRRPGIHVPPTSREVEEEEGDAERGDGLSTGRDDKHGGAAFVPSVNADSGCGALREGGVCPVVASERRAGPEEEIEAEAEAAAAAAEVEERDANAGEVERIDGETSIPPSSPSSVSDGSEQSMLVFVGQFQNLV